MSLGVTLLGPDIDHRRSLEVMLGSGCRVNWIPDSNSFLSGRQSGWFDRLHSKAERVFGTRSADYLELVSQALQANQSSVVVAYWGTEPLADLMALRRVRPDLKLLLMVLCFPVALNIAGIRRQNWMMRRTADLLDGLLFPNEAMRDHFIAEGLMPRQRANMVLPPCWAGALQAQGSQPAGLSEPNMIFIGRTDLSSSTVHKADDLRSLMRECLDAGILLYHGQSRETEDGHPFRRPFAPVCQSQLIENMACHDVSLIAYNLAACDNDARFDLTVPDRLLSSVAAGVPIAVPRSGYTGLKQYLAGHEALIEFDSPPGLMRVLRDRAHVEVLRKAAWDARPRFAAERHGAALRDFLGTLT